MFAIFSFGAPLTNIGKMKMVFKSAPELFAVCVSQSKKYVYNIIIHTKLCTTMRLCW